jgi:hypothetical protein
MDRRKFLVCGSVATVAGLSMEAFSCNPEEWFQIAAGLLPIVLQTVSAFETGNGGLPASAEAAITTFGTDATQILNDVTADIKTVQTTPGVIPKIDALLAQLKTQAQTLLPQFTGNSKVLGWINAILADAIDLANLVPVVTTVTANVRVVKMKVSLPSAKNYEAIFQHRLQVAQAL